MSTSTENATTPTSTTAASTRAKTWADVRNEEGIRGLSIQIHGFGEITTKPWARDSMEQAHWDRIVSIAETSQKEASFHPERGFSWVSLVALADGSIVKLAPPAHLAALIEQK